MSEKLLFRSRSYLTSDTSPPLTDRTRACLTPLRGISKLSPAQPSPSVQSTLPQLLGQSAIKRASGTAFGLVNKICAFIAESKVDQRTMKGGIKPFVIGVTRIVRIQRSNWKKHGPALLGLMDLLILLTVQPYHSLHIRKSQVGRRTFGLSFW